MNETCFNLGIKEMTARVYESVVEIYEMLAELDPDLAHKDADELPQILKQHNESIRKLSDQDIVSVLIEYRNY